MEKLKGKKVVILTAQEFEDIELLVPIIRLSEEGADITVATLPKEAYAHFHPRPYFPEKPVTGRFGSTVPLLVLEEGKRYDHKIISELKVEDYDALIVPGGFAPDYLRINDTTLNFVKDMYEAGKLVAAICHGPWVFISTDAVLGTEIIKDRKVTCYRAVKDDIKNAGGNYENIPAATEGNVITGRQPDDLPDFLKEIIKYLS